MKIAYPVALALMFSWSASASDKHGGQEVEAGKFHVELVVKDKDLSFYVRDASDKPIASKTVKASANVLSGKDKAAVDLLPAGNEMLAGRRRFSIHKEAKVLVTFSVAGGKERAGALFSPRERRSQRPQALDSQSSSIPGFGSISPQEPVLARGLGGNWQHLGVDQPRQKGALSAVDFAC